MVSGTKYLRNILTIGASGMQERLEFVVALANGDVPVHRARDASVFSGLLLGNLVL